jgi:hypothetical protein
MPRSNWERTAKERGIATALVQSEEPIFRAVHLCVDMQSIFARGGIWETPWMERVLRTIVGVAEMYPAVMAGYTRARA